MAKIERKAGRTSARHAPFRSTETFSKSFSKGVRDCSSMHCQSTLYLFGESRNLEPKNGHAPPDSDPRLQSEPRLDKRLQTSQPSGTVGFFDSEQLSNYSRITRNDGQDTSGQFPRDFLAPDMDQLA